jgi:7-cyano-7-deazaguanine synthase in queuosine biosynthesis
MSSIHDSLGETTKGLKKVILFSGGVDSFVGWHYCGKPDLLYCGIEHRYADLEETAIAKLVVFLPELGRKLKTTDVFEKIGSWERPDAEIPARNLLLAIAAVEKGYSHVCLICQEDERAIPDRSPSFFESTSHMLSLLFGRDIFLDPVFPQHDKTDMIKWFLDHSLATDYSREKKIDLLKQTVACYTPAIVPGYQEKLGLDQFRVIKQCGACPACFRRAIAFSLNGIEEEYAVNPWKTKVAKEYFEKAAGKGFYSPKRCDRIMQALMQHGSIVSRAMGSVKWEWVT